MKFLHILCISVLYKYIFGTRFSVILSNYHNTSKCSFYRSHYLKQNLSNVNHVRSHPLTFALTLVTSLQTHGPVQESRQLLLVRCLRARGWARGSVPSNVLKQPENLSLAPEKTFILHPDLLPVVSPHGRLGPGLDV